MHVPPASASRAPQQIQSHSPPCVQRMDGGPPRSSDRRVGTHGPGVRRQFVLRIYPIWSREPIGRARRRCRAIGAVSLSSTGAISGHIWIAAHSLAASFYRTVFSRRLSGCPRLFCAESDLSLLLIRSADGRPGGPSLPSDAGPSVVGKPGPGVRRQVVLRIHPIWSREPIGRARRRCRAIGAVSLSSTGAISGHIWIAAHSLAASFYRTVFSRRLSGCPRLFCAESDLSLLLIRSADGRPGGPSLPSGAGPSVVGKPGPGVRRQFVLRIYPIGPREAIELERNPPEE